MFHYQIYLFFFLVVVSSGYGQNSTKHPIHFIRVVGSQTTMRPPSERIETEISNGQICFRAVLPPRETIYKYGLEKYDELNKPPVNITPDPADYDSITNFILTSGLLNIDLNYTKPVPVNGVVAMKTGGGYGYTIETSEGLINLPVYDSRDFKLPEVLSNFDALYRRTIARYQIKNEP
ncbi:MAG: hypothetical protein CVT99_12300 [Bacteroidetes bacterium HGW-Bacteroidetes-16]|nr:MAG: hypothetical protein CVT99_12300 [Bacteroidetes bacterium HGW-Bacteroidetes-16]